MLEINPVILRCWFAIFFNFLRERFLATLILLRPFAALIHLTSNFFNYKALFLAQILHRNFFNFFLWLFKILILILHHIICFKKLGILSWVWIIDQMHIILINSKLLFVDFWHVKLRARLWVANMHFLDIFQATVFEDLESVFYI